MNTFFYISGIVLWTIIGIAAAVLLVSMIWNYILNPLVSCLANLKFALFGNRKWNGRYYEIWRSYTTKPGVRAKWKQYKHLKRFAYKRLFKEAWRETHETDTD